MKKITLILLSLFCFEAMSYIPTPMALFRNGSNGFYSKNGIELIFKLSQIKLKNNIFESSAVSYDQFIKMIIVKTPSNKMKAVIAEYSTGKMNANDIQRVRLINDLHTYYRLQGKEHAELFICSLGTLGFNDENCFFDFFKNYEIAVVSNQMLLNQNVLNLIDEYKRYIIQLSKGEENLVSPLQKKDEQTKELVLAMKTNGIYRKLESYEKLVSYEKVHNQLYLTLKRNNFIARFDQDTHQLREVSFNKEERSTLVFEDYQTKTGDLIFPNHLIINLGQERLFKFKTLSYKPVELDESDLEKEAKRLNDFLIENKKNPGFVGPAFNDIL